MKMQCDQWLVTNDKTCGEGHVTCAENEARAGYSRHTTRVTRHSLAFTLLEVMIAVVIFCTAMFAILGLVAQSIDNARRLQSPTVDAGMVAAAVYATTNKIVEIEQRGNLGDILGDAYKNYTWDTGATPVEVETNRFYRVDITIKREDNDAIVSQGSYLFYRPDSPPGSLDGGAGIRGRD